MINFFNIEPGLKIYVSTAFLIAKERIFFLHKAALSLFPGRVKGLGLSPVPLNAERKTLINTLWGFAFDDALILSEGASR